MSLTDLRRALATPAWMAHAECRGFDPDLFHPGRGEDLSPARTVCAACPVRADCLEHALAADERLGVWGGMSYAERRRELARRRRARFRPCADRVLARVVAGPDGCWIFTGATNAKGYGYARVGREIVGAHVVVYEAEHGAVGRGRHVHHSCGRRRCVRPDHLTAVTPRENDRLARALRPPWNVQCRTCWAPAGRPCRSVARRHGRLRPRSVRAHRSRRVAINR